MPKGPRGEKRPADVIGNAVKVMRIATGEETEELETDRAKSAAAELGSRGGKARAAQMTPGADQHGRPCALKHEEVHLKAYANGLEARIGIGQRFPSCKDSRPDQA